MAYYHYLWLTQFSTKIIIYYQTAVTLYSFSAQIKCLVKDQKLSRKKYCWFFVCSFWFCEIFCVAEKKKRLSSIAHFWVKLRFNLMWLLARRGRQLPICPVQVGFNSAAAAAALVKLIVFIVLHSSNTNTISNMDTVMRIVFYCTTLSSAWWEE